MDIIFHQVEKLVVDIRRQKKLVRRLAKTAIIMGFLVKNIQTKLKRK
jgi:hypothetical protein